MTSETPHTLPLPLPRLAEAQILALYNISRTTLHRWVALGTFPAPLKIGVTRRWRPEDLAAWEAAREAAA